jgi:hypothetical protein
VQKKAEQQKAASKCEGASIVPTKDRIDWPYVAC